MKVLSSLALVLLLTGCAVTPQTLQVEPQLEFSQLNGVTVPIELLVEDKRENSQLLGYRNANNEGPISFNDSLAKSLGIALQQAMQDQGIDMDRQPEPLTKLKVTVERLRYSSPNKDWVSHVEIEGEIVISIQRGQSELTKRFSANRSQDVATAPTLEFNQKYLNTLLSELFNKALNDKEIVTFLK